MNVEDVRSVFGNWRKEDLLAAGIKLKESFDPPFDRHYDYRMVYEVWLEPSSLDKAAINFAITDTGHVAVGIETYERVVERTALKAIRRGFAAGQEPTAWNKEGLQILFDAVSQGRIFLVVNALLGIITSVKFYMYQSECRAIAHTGYETKWILEIPDNQRIPSVRFGKILSYRPWR
jgi:hypothetical protein